MLSDKLKMRQDVFFACASVGITVLARILYSKRHEISKALHERLTSYLAVIIIDTTQKLDEDEEFKNDAERLLLSILRRTMANKDLNRDMALQSYEVMTTMMTKPLRRVPVVGEFISGVVRGSIGMLKGTIHDDDRI
jgi:hypothetical protein